MLRALNEMHYAADASGRAFAHAGGFDSVVLWAPGWAKLEPRQGQIDESQWTAFDADVAAAHADGLQTFVACSSQSPGWAVRVRGRGTSGRVAPDDLSPSGPWAHHIERVLARHPRVQGVIVLNEPNLAFIEAPRRFIECTAAMIQTAATVWQRNGATPLLLAPACADLPDGSGWASVRYFTNGVLRALAGWEPPHGVHLEWAHHAYTDVRANRPTTGTPLVRHVLDLLGKYRRPRRVWLTEGGYEFHTELNPNYPGGYYWQETAPLAGQEQTQLTGVRDLMRWCERLDPTVGIVRMFSQYLYQDVTLSGGGWMSGMVRPDGSARPLANAWRSL